MTDDPVQDLMPESSRDGRTLYFTSSRGGSFGIWKMRVSGGIAIRLTGECESPDGKFF
jgi:Tol biopolymer transport system component